MRTIAAPGAPCRCRSTRRGCRCRWALARACGGRTHTTRNCPPPRSGTPASWRSRRGHTCIVGFRVRVPSAPRRPWRVTRKQGRPRFVASMVGGEQAVKTTEGVPSRGTAARMPALVGQFLMETMVAAERDTLAHQASQGNGECGDGCKQCRAHRSALSLIFSRKSGL